jgi:hypothetical protein
MIELMLENKSLTVVLLGSIHILIFEQNLVDLRYVDLLRKLDRISTKMMSISIVHCLSSEVVRST